MLCAIGVIYDKVNKTELEIAEEIIYMEKIPLYYNIDNNNVIYRLENNKFIEVSIDGNS